MFALLKIKVSGYKMLPDNFIIDFTTKARVVSNECFDDSEIFEIAENLYAFNIIAITGSNSSGKSTVLSLLSKILHMMTSGRWQYTKGEFNSNEINLQLEFFLNNVIYIYKSTILKNNQPNDFALNNQYCTISNEELKYAAYRPNVGKRYASELDYEVDYYATGIDDTSKLVFLCKNQVIGYFLTPFSINGVIVSNSFFDCLRIFDGKLTISIIRLLDESIEKIEYLGVDNVKFKRFGEEEKIISRIDLINCLSNGTVKGIELYVRIVSLIKNGGIMLVDEIENCFHKNLVNNILYLLMDKTINKNNAQIIFTTHYVEILDILNRRDNIFVMHKKESKISISNIYEDYDLRTEISKSRQFNKNAFDTLLNYERLMLVKRLIKNEIFDND